MITLLFANIKVNFYNKSTTCDMEVNVSEGSDITHFGYLDNPHNKWKWHKTRKNLYGLPMPITFPLNATMKFQTNKVSFRFGKLKKDKKHESPNWVAVANVKFETGNARIVYKEGLEIVKRR